MPIPKSKIALIHVAKRKLGMDDAEYRAALLRVGVSSARDLDGPKFAALMDHFERCGFLSRRNTRTRVSVPQTKARITAKIAAIREELGLSWAYVDGIAKKMHGVDAIEWCTPDQLHAVLKAMIYHQKRKKHE